jgi:hypothetical protein|tara:strand:+ start:948 stop:1385 length:438 start_codon:yes stop_codon:yes gene_type:complete
MAIIYSYPSVTPLGEDFLIGSQKSSSNATKNFTVDSVVSAGLGYTAYAALISQSGTNAPTATVLKNNTGHTYTWARTGSGTYTITANGNAFTNNKTVVFNNNGLSTGSFGFASAIWTRTSDTVITITTGGDGRITNGSFEVRIYS